MVVVPVGQARKEGVRILYGCCLCISLAKLAEN